METIKIISSIDNYDYFDGSELLNNQKAGKEFWLSSSDSDEYVNSWVEISFNNERIRFDLFGNQYQTVYKSLARTKNLINSFEEDDLKTIARLFNLEYAMENNLGSAYVKGHRYQINKLRYKKSETGEYILINVIGGTRAPESQLIYGIWKVQVSNDFREKYFKGA